MALVRSASPTLVCAVLTAAAAIAAPQPAPQLVSPGNERQEGRVGSECPTFSWAPAPGSTGYALMVYGVSGAADAAGDASPKPLLEAELPEGATSWTPSLGACLPGAGHYSWAVGARGEDGSIHWSTPGVFRVLAPAAPREQEPRHPATTTRLDGVSAPIIQSPAPANVASSRAASAPPRSLGAEAFSPPACTGIFSDVTLAHPLCAWIEKTAADKIVGECAVGRYCPDNPVTRSQLALFGERIMRGTDTWRPELGDAATPNLPPGPPIMTPLDTPGDVGQWTSITIGADGLGLISYFDGLPPIIVPPPPPELALDDPPPPNNDLKVAHCSNVDCTAATLTSLDTAGNVGEYTSVTIGADGLGLISYHDRDNLDLKVAHCSNVNCTAATITPLDTAGDVGLTTSITIGADGWGLISYAGLDNQKPPALYLKVAHCADFNCSSTTVPPTSLDTTGAGAYSSITIGADGFGLISYADLSDGDLKVAHCSNFNCTAAIITTLDDSAVADGVTVGEYTSITIGADGLGLISYWDRTNADLKVAHCSNVNCTAATITPLDTAGDVGEFTSVTIGADGLGLISYRDATNNDLKIAHCSNVLCAPYFRRR
jgi:hypothetical protein